MTDCWHPRLGWEHGALRLFLKRFGPGASSDDVTFNTVRGFFHAVHYIIVSYLSMEEDTQLSGLGVPKISSFGIRCG